MKQKELNEITDKLIKLADEKREEDSYNKGYVDGLYHALRVFRGVYFDQEPKGKWKHSDRFMSEDWYQCSNCKNEIFIEQGTLPQDEDYNFCPKCGVMMEY